MYIWTRPIGWLKAWLFSYLMSRQSFVNTFLDKLSESHPADIASRADPNLVVASAQDQIVGIVVNECGDKVLERMSESRMLDVITTINKKAAGSFKYVGNGDVRVIIGSGGQSMEGWLATDIDQLNIVDETSWNRLFNLGSIDRMLAEHVLEHLTLRELNSALRHAYKYLKPGGILRVAVPDAFHPSRYYYNLVKPGGRETPYEHMLFLEHELLSRISREVGFEVKLLEYFDEKGIFHGTDYRGEDGVIQRCASNNCGLDTQDVEVMTRFYSSIPEHLRQQFVDRRMSYTSLIVDLIKPQ